MLTAIESEETSSANIFDGLAATHFEAPDWAATRPRPNPSSEPPATPETRETAFSRLEVLFSGDESAAVERLSDAISCGDLDTLLILVSAIKRPSPLDEDGTYASLALETIASSRRTWIEPLVIVLVQHAASSRLSDLRFTSVAAAGDLSREGRLKVLATIRALHSDPEPDIAEAAQAFTDVITH